MLHVLRVGCPWRDMHERYGKWNSVYVRFRRWAEQGVWDALLACRDGPDGRLAAHAGQHHGSGPFTGSGR
nr:transposase [Rhizobium sp. 42MFCr.1]